MKKILMTVKKVVINKTNNMIVSVRNVLASQSGEGFFDTAIKILIAVVIGALILGGVYMIWGDTLLPNLQQKITDMFNYSG